MDNVSNASLADDFARVRAQSLTLCETLSPEDTVVQSMPDVSPAKWHLAHVTWFFERMVLEAFDANYSRYNDAFHYLFNSYYYSVGEMHARPDRGLLSRPGLEEVLAYRAYVDEAMVRLLDSDRVRAPGRAPAGGGGEVRAPGRAPAGGGGEVRAPGRAPAGGGGEVRAPGRAPAGGGGEGREAGSLADRVVLGLNHEQQHQELLLTDIKHVLSCNPLRPVMHPGLVTGESQAPGEYRYSDGPEGIHAVGATGLGFAFDNETPRHDTLLHPHRIGGRLVTGGEFREFVRDGGYRDSDLWLSDGWAVINDRGWDRPLYWSEDLQSEFTLGGQRDIDDNAPVTHVSYYEADAFARWAGARLPTEFEWEIAAGDEAADGNFLETKAWHPLPGNGSKQFFGDAWEWTSSSYAPYPGFVPLAGSLGEYNGKFMCNQMTVRGGSCVTAADHIRASYRSFFYPDARWQFLGFRLAKDRLK